MRQCVNHVSGIICKLSVRKHTLRSDLLQYFRMSLRALRKGEKMSPLCREFGISRVTGYKIFNRYKDCGLDGLNDRSRRPYRQSNKLPFQIERTILGIKKEHPSWGAPKIRDKLVRAYPMIKPPAISTIHAVLDRNGLVKRKKPRLGKCRTPGTAVTSSRPQANGR